jgi:ketosteroid isomerase-like protein
MFEQHPNVRRVLQGMQAFNADDVEGVKAIYRPDMVYRVAGQGPLSGEYNGIEEYAAVVQRVRDDSGSTMTLDTDVVLANDHTVMMLVKVYGEREGRILDSESMYVFRFDEDGMCYKGRTIPVDQYAYDAFWA